ncbi:MAG: nuclear transport factor 2 family protein [Cyclobacteriaceae bacterium]|nr:nuclear transport factor 2 family protein [Cyclobacteriaceae bacterium]
MKRTILTSAILLVSILIIAQKPSKDELAIKQLIEDYKISINKADTILGAKIWAHVPEVSFIHPRGHEKGWKGVKDNFYGMFRTRFNTRDLKSYDEKISVYDEVAWVEFYWIYDATYSDDKPMQSKGRETQILKKFGKDWKIVHVHYSGMPVTGERQGF